MEQKVRIGISALWIIGLVFSIMGGLFVAIGLLSLAAMGPENWLFGVIFGGIGGLFFVLGVVFLVTEWKKKRMAERLIAAGRYVWGEVVDVVADISITINNRHPYIALVHYQDGRGTIHQFRSPSLRISHSTGMIGKKVKVYIEDGSYRHYYVELDGILPQVIEH